MSTIANKTELCARIEALIQEHIAASRDAALATLRRAFSQETTASSAGVATRPRTRATTQYRSKEALEALQRDIYDLLKLHPGLGAADLSARLNLKSSDLAAPMTKLRKRDMVRCVGLRSAMRYFPVTEKN